MNDPSNAPRIMAIIVTWNKKEYVLNLLNSLKHIDYPEGALDIVVVDNASNDDTVVRIKQHYPDVTLIVNSENLGGTGGFNTGLKHAFEQPAGAYDYLWLLDNDVLVHSRALPELVVLLEEHKDAAIAGSTMMQLDYPYRINEMGAFVDRRNGKLILNRHMDEIHGWKDCGVESLLTSDVNRNIEKFNSPDYLDVDYVAAASLLIRADVAKQAGLWLDFFIHFDDVEWCLRIAQMGHRVLVSAKSLIWHLSAAAKIPTWILYYDNRNLLYLLDRHGKNRQSVRTGILKVLLKTTRQVLIRKPETAQLFLDAADDFVAGRTGKKDFHISSQQTCMNHKDVVQFLFNPSIKRIAISWTIDWQSKYLISILEKVKSVRDDVEIDFLNHGDKSIKNVPFSFNVIEIPDHRLFRWLKFFRLRKKYDLAIQSEYLPLSGIACFGCEQLYVNDQHFCIRPVPRLPDVIKTLLNVVKRWKYWMLYS